MCLYRYIFVPKTKHCLTKSPEICNEVDTEIRAEFSLNVKQWNSPNSSSFFHVSRSLRKKIKWRSWREIVFRKRRKLWFRVRDCTWFLRDDSDDVNNNNDDDDDNDDNEEEVREEEGRESYLYFKRLEHRKLLLQRTSAVTCESKTRMKSDSKWGVILEDIHEFHMCVLPIFVTSSKNFSYKNYTIFY